MTPISPFPLLMLFICAIIGMFVLMPPDPGHSVFGATFGGALVGGLLGMMIAYVILGVLEETTNCLGSLWYAQHTEIKLSKVATGSGTRYVVEKRVRFPMGWGRWAVIDSYNNEQRARDNYDHTLNSLVNKIADIRAQHKQGDVSVLNAHGTKHIDHTVNERLIAHKQYKQEL